MTEDCSPRAFPEWDQTIADAAIGKTILVGIAYVSPHDGTVLRQRQYHGLIVRADQELGVHIECKDDRAGEEEALPPDMSIFTPGAPGEYRLRSTGEVVLDPDFVSTWTVKATDKKN